MCKDIHILHVDDDPSITDLAATFLERENDRISVETATSASEGLERINDRPPDCIVSDYNMPGMDGLEFLQTVREECPDLPFILFTGKGSEAVASQAIAADVTSYLQKQVGTEQYELLANRIQNAVQARREVKRADRQEQLTRLTEFAGDTGGFEVDMKTGDILLTDGAERIIDAGEDAALTIGTGLGWIHPKDQEEVRREIDRAVETGEQTRGTWRYQPPDREQQIIEWVFTTTSTNGSGTTLRGSISDITDRRERQQDLKKYETVVDSLTDAVYVVDEDGRFTYVNDELVELVGYDRERILGSRPSLIKDQESVDRAEEELGRLLSSDGPETVTFEVTIQPRTGDPIVCEDHMGVLPYEGDTFDGSVGVLRDITEHKEYERELEAKNERLEEFTSIASHDLRNPLGVAEGHLELAGATEDNEHLAKAADAIERSQALIDDLLTLAREGDQVDESEPVDLAKVAESSWRTVETPQATLDAGAAAVIEADRSRLQELLENLYRNSVEHGGDGATVHVGELDDGFYVADTGSGIPESERDEIFAAGYSTADDGTGFGLRIVAQIVEAHGWEVSVTESEQDGARFEVTGVEKGQWPQSALQND